MTGDSRITAGPLPPGSEVSFNPVPSPKGNESPPTAPGPLAGSKVVTPAKDYRWVRCKGCGGEVGIQSDWQEAVDCPACGAPVQLYGRVLYRPPVAPLGDSGATVTHSRSIQAAERKPSLELERMANNQFIWGILCVVLGWTFVVPLFGVGYYCLDLSKQAKEEGVLVPTKGTVGLILCLLFGIVQSIGMIAHFNK